MVHPGKGAGGFGQVRYNFSGFSFWWMNYYIKAFGISFNVFGRQGLSFFHWLSHCPCNLISSWSMYFSFPWFDIFVCFKSLALFIIFSSTVTDCLPLMHTPARNEKCSFAEQICQYRSWFYLQSHTKPHPHSSYHRTSSSIGLPSINEWVWDHNHPWHLHPSLILTGQAIQWRSMDMHWHWHWQARLFSRDIYGHVLTLTWRGVRRKEVCTRVDLEGQKNCFSVSPCPAMGSNPGSSDFNSDSWTTEPRPSDPFDCNNNNNNNEEL